MAVKKLVVLLFAVFVVVGLGTVVVIRATQPDQTTPVAASSGAAQSKVSLPSSTATTNSAATRADYLYLLPTKLVLMRGSDVLASVPRVFDTADPLRNKVIWTNSGDFVALLSDAALQDKPVSEYELISINARTGAQQRLPCPRCSDITPTGTDSVLVSVTTGQSTEDHLVFDLRAGGTTAPVGFPPGNGEYWVRFLLGSTRDRVVTMQATTRREGQQLIMVKVGATTGKEIGYFGMNSHLPFASFEGPTGPRFALASRQSASPCRQTFSIWLFDAEGGSSPTDMSAVYPPGSRPGTTSGIDVNDLWWTPEGQLRATIASWKCPGANPDPNHTVVHQPSTMWKLDGTKWVNTGFAPATMVREFNDDTRIVFVKHDCTGETTEPEPAVYCNTGQLVRESRGSRTLVAEQVLRIATPPVSVPSRSSTSPPPPEGASAAVTPFVGTWTQHAGSLVIKADGTVAMTYQAFAGTAATFPKLTLKITNIAGAQAATTVLTSEDAGVPVGSSFTLELQHPGIVAKSASGEMSKWCNPKNQAAGECGA